MTAEIKTKRLTINQIYLADEAQIVQDLLVQFTAYDIDVISPQARQLLETIRGNTNRQFTALSGQSITQAFLKEISSTAPKASC